MRPVNAEFLVSAASAKGFLYAEEKPVIAVCGRSNVGKSSFINMLSGRKKLARTSGDPGRTRLINYFDFGDFIFADLPGYGYARVSAAEKQKWARLLEDFFAREGTVTHALALADIRHDPTADDIAMIGFLNAARIPFTVIATKADKLAKTRVKEAVRRLAAAFRIGEGDVIAVSALTQLGKDAVFSALDAVCERFAASAEEEPDAAEE